MIFNTHETQYQIRIPKRVVEIGECAIAMYLQMYTNNGVMTRNVPWMTYGKNLDIPFLDMPRQLALMEQDGIVVAGKGILSEDIDKRDDIVTIDVPESVLNIKTKEKYEFVKNAVLNKE